MGLGYADDDLESKEFFDNLPMTKASDEKSVKLHLGRHSHRRARKDPYSTNESGQLCYRGQPLNNGGYVDGILRCKARELACYGPGEIGSEVHPEESERLFGHYDDEAKEYWTAGTGTLMDPSMDVSQTGGSGSSDAPPVPVAHAASQRASTLRRHRRMVDEQCLHPMKDKLCSKCGCVVHDYDARLCGQCGETLERSWADDVGSDLGEGETAMECKALRDPGQPALR
jgi:hypothetical protein